MNAMPCRLLLLALSASVPVTWAQQAAVSQEQEQAAMRHWKAELSLAGVKSEAIARQITKSQIEISSFGSSFDEAGQAIEIFKRKGFGESEFIKLGKASQDTIKIFGGNLPDVAQKVANGFSGNLEDIEKFDNQYNFLSMSALNHIVALEHKGNTKEASEYALDFFVKRISDASAKATIQATEQPPATTNPQPSEAPSPEAARLQAVERQLNALRDQLGITPAQQPQWAAFADIRRANAARDARAIVPPQSGAQENALRMMRDYARATRSYAENIERALPAFEALYGALSPQQRRIADKAFLDRRREMMRAGRN